MARPPPRGVGEVWTLRSLGLSTNPRRGERRMRTAVSSQEIASAQPNNSAKRRSQSGTLIRGPFFVQSLTIVFASLLQEVEDEGQTIIRIGPRPRLERAGVKTQRHLGE